MRTGIMLGPEDFRSRRPTAAARPAASPPELIYVVEGMPGLVKIGVSGDPLARLAQLQTGSHTALTLAYSAAVKSNNAMPLEQAVHVALDRYRQNGEWFSVPTAAAVAAIAAASHQLGDPIVQIANENLRYVIDRARAEAAMSSPKRSYRKWWWVLIGGWALFFLIIAATIANAP